MCMLLWWVGRVLCRRGSFSLQHQGRLWAQEIQHGKKSASGHWGFKGWNKRCNFICMLLVYPRRKTLGRLCKLVATQGSMIFPCPAVAVACCWGQPGIEWISNCVWIFTWSHSISRYYYLISWLSLAAVPAQFIWRGLYVSWGRGTFLKNGCLEGFSPCLIPLQH